MRISNTSLAELGYSVRIFIYCKMYKHFFFLLLKNIVCRNSCNKSELNSIVNDRIFSTARTNGFITTSKLHVYTLDDIEYINYNIIIIIIITIRDCPLSNGHYYYGTRGLDVYDLYTTESLCCNGCWLIGKIKQWCIHLGIL